MIDSFQAYQLYRSLKLHFTSEKYDFFLYRGSIKNVKSIKDKNRFLESNTKYYYETLGKHKDPGNLLVSNFIINPKMFITEIISNEGQENYNNRVARLSSLYYNFEQELRQFSSIKQLMSTTSSNLPIIIERYISKRVSAETVVILDSVLNKFDEWQKIDHPLLDKHVLILKKYKPFVPIDKKRIQKVFEKHYK